MICPKCKKVYSLEKRYCSNCIVLLVDAIAVPQKDVTAPPILKNLVWLGILVTVSSTVVHFFHIAREVNFIALVLTFSLSIALEILIFVYILKLKNWARRLFIVLFVLLGVPYIPFILMRYAPWHSSYGIMSVVPIVVDILEYGFNIFFIFFLFRPKIRFLFISKSPKTYQRVLLIILACLTFLLGMGWLVFFKWFSQYFKI